MIQYITIMPLQKTNFYYINKSYIRYKKPTILLRGEEKLF